MNQKISQNNWVCYLIISLDTNQTYVGSTNNINKRLNNHNNNDVSIKRIGAKATRGQTWIPLIFVSGFESKISCLSFEAGWKRLAKTRNNFKLSMLSEITGIDLKYTQNSHYNRIMDLLYFINHVTYIYPKYIMNHQERYPWITPSNLKINVLFENWILNVPWPYFIKCVIV